MDNNYSPLVICRRLVNFISNIVFGRPSPDPEIMVDFKHTDDHSQIGDHAIKGSETIESQQQILVRDSEHQEIGTVDEESKGKGKKVQEVGEASLKRPKKGVTIKEDEKMMNKKRDREEEDRKKPRAPRHWGPLLSVASNINDKCEAFINSRKRAMRRNYTLDPPEKS